MADTIENKLQEWVCGKNPEDARIAIFNKIRDIPYAIIPELNDHEQYIKILEFNRGSCTPKHFLLCNMYRILGLEVLYAVYPYRWDEFNSLYPPDLARLASDMPIGHHLACKVEIGEKLVLIDATLDSPLGIIGLPVNTKWDGIRDTSLPVTPCGEEQLYHPSEVHLMQTQQLNEMSLAFYNGLNAWMEKVRTGNSSRNSTI